MRGERRGKEKVIGETQINREETRRGYKRWGRETKRGEKIRAGEEKRRGKKTKTHKG